MIPSYILSICLLTNFLSFPPTDANIQVHPISCKVCTTYMKKYVSCLVNGGDFEECVDTPQDEVLHGYVTLGGEKRVCMCLDILMRWLYKVWETRWGVCSLP